MALTEDTLPHPDLPERAALAVRDAFNIYHAEFKRITRRAQARFEKRDWAGAQGDAVERLELYSQVIQRVLPELRDLLGAHAASGVVWAAMKTVYAERITGRKDYELAATFFNSLTRRVFTTVGVNEQIEFVEGDFEPLPPPDHSPIFNAYACEGAEKLPELLARVLEAYPLRTSFRDLPGDASLAAQRIAAHLTEHWGAPAFDHLELVRSIFYRDNAAYLIGRICRSPDAGQTQSGDLLPLVLCLRNPPSGLTLDAVLLDEDDVSILFSFTRAYFHVEAEHPHALIDFVKTILPLKRIAELYISIGYNKHGKTEFFRDFMRHLANSSDKLERARGERGMVMAVFTLPSYDMVFKVIKDKMDDPKTTSRAEVKKRYELVFKHDRAGRLVDAQEFEYLRFERARFAPELLQELLAVAPSQVFEENGCVVVRHLYIERRTTPLNLYVQEADAEAARLAVIDYGQTLKDLAATNIFPGDVLLKNFGVTRHGRVVFYDYDELSLLTENKFRRLPQPRDDYETYAADPWFYIGPNDIFPEQFDTFLGLQGDLRQAFSAAHSDLFEVSFWRTMQAQQRSGVVLDILPYPESRRLRPGATGAEITADTV